MVGIRFISAEKRQVRLGWEGGRSPRYEYAIRVRPLIRILPVVLCQNGLVGAMMGDGDDDDVDDDVGDNVLSCHGRNNCSSPTLLPFRR